MAPGSPGGSKAMSIAVARMVAEPVCLVRCQASANSTRALPKSETAWLLHKTRKVFMMLLLSPI